MMNIDGVCLLSRYNPIVISHKKIYFHVLHFRSLLAFKVGLFSEAHAYTTRKVTNHYSYISKCDYFNTTYSAVFQPHANFVPGFQVLGNRWGNSQCDRDFEP